MAYSRLPAPIRARVLAEARASKHADLNVEYPEWYLRRMHRLPEGYLSNRSVRLYEAIIANLYNAGQPSYVAEQLARRIAAEGPAEVVELGCGPGVVLRALARRCPTAAVTGVDLSPFMLEAAARRAPDAGLVHADVAALGLGRRYDAVVAVHVFGHMPRAVSHRALGIALQHVKPGGRLHVVEHSWHRLPPVDAYAEAEPPTRLLGGLLTHQTWKGGIE